MFIQPANIPNLLGPKYTGYHRVLSPEHQQHISPTSNYDPIERTHAAHNDDDDDDEPSEGTAMTDEQVVAVADMLDDALADILQRSTMVRMPCMNVVCSVCM